MKLIYTSILFLITLLSFSQEIRLIRGRVYLNDFNQSISGVYVKNNLTGYTTLTDITGQFSIPAQEGDIIVFQSYNIENRSIVITSTMYQNKIMVVQLDVKEKEIPGILVTPFKSYGSIELDVKRIPMMNKTNELLAKLGSLAPTKKLDGSTDIDSELAKLATMKIGIDGILGAFSGDSKKQERLSAYEDRNQTIKNIRDYFGDEYFIGIGLKENEINEFILYVYLNHNVDFYYQNKNYFQILNAFEKNVLAFKERKNPPLYNTPKVGKPYFNDETKIK